MACTKVVSFVIVLYSFFVTSIIVTIDPHSHKYCSFIMSLFSHNAYHDIRFWGMLSYLANTLIFVLVGVVIAQRAFSGVEDSDWIALTSLYFAINVIR